MKEKGCHAFQCEEVFLHKAGSLPRSWSPWLRKERTKRTTSGQLRFRGLGGTEEPKRQPQRVGEAEGEPGELKGRTPGTKSMDVVAKHWRPVSLPPGGLMCLK